MSQSHNPLPPEREAAYLQNAQQSFAEAVAPFMEPVIQELGKLVISDAQDITRLDPEAAGHNLAANMAEKASKYDVLSTSLPMSQKLETNDDLTDPAALLELVEALRSLQRPTLQSQVWHKARERAHDPRFDIW